MKWISVDERLPENGVHVLCNCFEDHMQPCYYVDSTDYGDEGWSHHFKNLWDSYVSVTHWCPLPEPPE